LQQQAYQHRIRKAKQNTAALAHPDPIAYLESNVYIQDTGHPLALADEQKAVLREMFRRDADGRLLYEIMVYSAPKKSGKTQIGGGLAQWQAERIPNGEVYIVGNDLKQADNRMNQAIRYSVAANPRTRQSWQIQRNTIYLPNGTRIEAVPVDPAGEAGSNPTGIFWTEAWGAKLKKHEEMWSEMNLSSTRIGQAFKFVESYAGHTNESVVLERIYKAIVRPENLHPTIPELYIKDNIIVYWCTRHIMPWQQGEAYQRFLGAREAEMAPPEFRRQYWNEWVSSTNAFIDILLWDACAGDVPPLERTEQMIIALDAGVNNDCFGMVGVSKRGVGESAVIYHRLTKKWQPENGVKLDFVAIKEEVKATLALFPVLMVYYDEYQLHLFAQELQRETGIACKPFGQGAPRLIADKSLQTAIMKRQVRHDGTDADLREHLQNAAAKSDGEENRLRIVKMAEDRKVDLAVALSMAVDRANYLNIG